MCIGTLRDISIIGRVSSLASKSVSVDRIEWTSMSISLEFWGAMVELRDVYKANRPLWVLVEDGYSKEEDALWHTKLARHTHTHSLRV